MNSLKYTFRNIFRNKTNTIINTLGLSLGIASSLIITLFIIHELSFDQYNEKKDRIYRLNHHGLFGDREFFNAYSFPAFGPMLLKELPEVEGYTRVRMNQDVNIRYGDSKITVNDVMESDSSFFTLFSVPVITGNRNTILKESHSLVLSESTAKQIFGSDDPINKTLLIEGENTPFKITGIMSDIPETSHFNANIIVLSTDNFNSKPGINCITYILLKPNTNPELLNPKIMGVLEQSRGGNVNKIATRDKDEFCLESLNDIHFNQSVQAFDNKPSSNKKYLSIFGSIAILIIVIAAINFMNLSTAQASGRAKEIGIKKVSGSSKWILIVQFLIESVILSLLSLILAVIIVKYSLPFLNNLLGLKLQLNLFSRWFTVPSLLVFSIIVGLIAGSYPSFFLSSFRPYAVLKGRYSESLRNGRLRSILVTTQFSISIILIVGTIVMVRQLHFMLNKDLGFDKEQILVINRVHNTVGNNVKPFKEAILRVPGVIKVASSSGVPGHTGTGLICEISGVPGRAIMLGLTDIDKDFFDTYGLKLTLGGPVNESLITSRDACIVNERTIKELNVKNPISRELCAGPKFIIEGVVKDFHFESLRNDIGPYVFKFNPDSSWRIDWRYVSVRLSPKATANTIAEIEKVWQHFSGNEPFQYFFMDQDFARMYKEERQNAQLATIFSILAIIIASLGLFGLTSFTIEQRTKEIGVRKTMGASVASISLYISKEFIVLVAVSSLLAIPVVYYFANKWLENYHYRIALRPFDFLLGFIVVAGIALLTISFKTIKSARTNPVEALRYE